MVAPRKYNPGFLSDDELVASFCVRTTEFESIMEMLGECTGASNPHQIVIGPRGSGKTTLLLRVAAEVRRDAVLSESFFPVVFAEESYEVGSAGEFWLECLGRLAVQAPERDGAPDLHRTYDELRSIGDDRALGDRCLGALLDFADREGRRLVLIAENVDSMFRDMRDPDAGWRIRKVLQTEPRIVLLASATSRFDEIDNPDQALYELFRVLMLRPLSEQECVALWEGVTGQTARREAIRALRILVGGSPRLFVIFGRFGADLSFRQLMADLLDLVDDHTEYFRSHLEVLAPQERRVYLALADLWRPATTREIADGARIQASKCSAQLSRLVDRQIVRVVGGTARRKEYYLAERLYSIYHLLRRPRGPDRLVESLIRFMAAYYSPRDLTEIGARIVRAAESTGGEMPPLARAASRRADRVLERTLTDSQGNRIRSLLVRARATLTSGDVSGCEKSIEALLAILSRLDSVPGEPIDALMELGVELGPVEMLELIRASPAVDLLLPLSTAFEQELGLEPRVAREVERVARDIRRELARLRDGR